MDTNVVETIRHAHERITWSYITILMCVVGYLVHWLFSYNKAVQGSRSLGTPIPKARDYWTTNWAVSWASLITVLVGYVMIPDLGVAWPTVGKFFGIVAEDNTVVGLTNFSAFLWGLCGPFLADYAGKRMSSLLA